MRYYIRTKEHWPLGAVIYKIYDTIPDDMPECFKKSTLIAFDEAVVRKDVSGQVSAVMREHSLTDKDSINRYLENTSEIDEDTYNTLIEGVKSIIENARSLMNVIGLKIKKNV